MPEPQVNIKERIKEEFVRCATDPVYFMKKYYMIQHPQRGRQLFDLYPFQEKVLRLFQKNDYSIINKSRQLGISTLVSAYSLWLMLFNRDKNVLVIATKQDTAKNMVTKVRFAYQNLPTWLKIGASEDNRLSLRLTNGSQVKAVSAAGDAGRSEAVSLLVIDEAAFIDNIETIFTAAQQTLATGGGCIALSTPNGVGNWFHKTYSTAQEQKNKFLPISLPWTVHPERDQTWRDDQDRVLGKRNAAQECFSHDVRVYTDKGLVKISNVKVGDNVLTHKGHYKPVVRTYVKESDDLYEFYTELNRKRSYVTKNHPFLFDKDREAFKEVSEIDSVYTFPFEHKVNSVNQTYDIYDNFQPKHFKKMLLGDKFYVNDRKHKIVHNSSIEVDKSLGKIVGLYLAEGSKNRLRVTYSFNYDTEINTWVNDLQNLIGDKFGLDSFHIRRQNNTGHLSINSEVFSYVIGQFVSGDSSHNKSLTSLAHKLSSAEFYEGILEGYMLGDGCLKQQYNKSFTTVSEDLYYDIIYISNILGYRNISAKYPKSLDLEYKDVMGRSCLCRPKFNASYLKTANTSSIYKSDLDKVKLYKEELDDTACLVYNLEVEEDHTYVTEYGIVHNCDCDFATSGNTVIEPDIMNWYEQNTITDPIERRGLDKALWIWEYSDPTKYYALIADVARGDGNDYSGFHVIDVETLDQVAEYKSQIDTREYANIILSTASEYNNALVVVENANIGWDVIQTILERGYNNVHYSYKQNANIEFTQYIDKYNKADGLVPGFSTTEKTRPLVIERMRDFIENKLVNIKSLRLLEELRVFIWKNGKAQAMSGYNDDLVMPFAIGMYLRETSLRYRKNAENLTYAALNSFTKTQDTSISYNANNQYNQNPWSMSYRTTDGEVNEDLTWLL